MDRLSDYDYDLPEGLIAQTPLEDRAASRLLVLERSTGSVAHRRFADCLEYLDSGDVLVLNDTRVTALRLLGKRATGGGVELLLLRDLGSGRFGALAKPAKKLSPGAELEFENGLRAIVTGVGATGEREVDFSADPHWRVRLGEIGMAPLPPYIHTPLGDRERYQTVYASVGGSAAAPTAGLHFTEPLLDAIEAKGVRLARVTLNVGLDTFRPVQAECLDDHAMHGEECTIDVGAVETIHRASGKVVAVGTTVVRTLESFAEKTGEIRPGTRSTKLFIRPGFDFRVVDAMFTNFHLPRTTMLMMLSAFVGRELLFRTYSEAIRERYRFLSFGDSMLVY